MNNDSDMTDSELDTLRKNLGKAFETFGSDEDDMNYTAMVEASLGKVAYPVKAFLIDPWACTVTEVEYDGNFKSIHRLIWAESFDHRVLTREGDGVYVDDTGLIDGETDRFFQIRGMFTDVLAGRGLVLGNDEAGRSVAPQGLTLAELRNRIVFAETGYFNGERVLVQTTKPTNVAFVIRKVDDPVMIWSTEEQDWVGGDWAESDGDAFTGSQRAGMTLPEGGMWRRV